MMKTIRIIGKLTGSRHLLVLLICSLIGINESRASHAAGADLTYEALGNGQYLVTFSFYRDCYGITAPTTQTMTVSSFTCGFSQTFTMPRVPGTGQEITYTCDTSTSTCNGGTAVGIQEYKYQVIVPLPAPCPDWEFRVSVSARNAAVTTIDDPDLENLFIDAYLNNSQFENNSPTFSNVPVGFLCIGQNNIFNHGVIDPDGDSLVYSFVAPRTDPNTPLTYLPGYSVANPVTTSGGTSINSSTGDIVLQPSQQEVAVMTVLITEYRNGEVVGSVMRDMQLYIVNCTNTLPTASGINGSQSFNTSSCIGGTLCFDVLTNDPDAQDTLTMTWNQAIPGATFTVTGPPNNPTGRFCWAPTPADARPQPYTFVVTVRDNACPSNGVGTATFSVTVSNMTVQLTSTPSIQCFGSHNGSASATATGNPPLSYIWTLPGGSVRTTPSISHLSGGNYTLNVVDGNGCVGTQYFNISEPPPLNVSITPTNAGCGGTTGSALANVTGGTPNYSYLWSPTNQTTANATNLTTNTYTVTVTDDNNCTATESVNIQSNTPVDFFINTTPATCVANNGSVTVTHQGGTGSYSYHWDPDIPGDTTTSSLTGLITGAYFVTATDLGTGCSETLLGIVANAAGISATITASSDATCETDDDGSATVAGSGGQLPYTYLWPNGDTTPTTNHLAPGTHLAMIEDYNGCRAYAPVTIGFNFPSPVVDLGPDTMPCIGDIFTMDAGAGFSSYLWSDNSAAQTLTVTTSGVYTVFVTNAANCGASDAVNVNFVTCATPPRTNITTSRSPVVVYPNPANSEIYVNISKIKNTDVTLTITDILGNALYFSSEYATSGYRKHIDIHTLPAGIYMVKVQVNDEVNISRLVKQ